MNSIKAREWTGYRSDDPQNTTEHLIACDLPTGWLQRIALQCYTHDNGRPMWRDIATTEADARDYYSSIDDPELARSEAAAVLGAYGWTRAMICGVFS